MLTRALLAFLALPGMVAFAIPAAWLWHAGHRQPMQPLGLIPLVCGSVALLWCVRDFYVAGRGTLAPWAPPEKLVVIGLYRYSRNPMYVAVALVVAGWTIAFEFRPLFVYELTIVTAFHLRVVLAEEPWLARRHGAQWEEYVRTVPRWFGPAQATRNQFKAS